MKKSKRRKLPASVRKYIRVEKARIKREFLTKEKQQQEMGKLLSKFKS